MYDFIIIIIVLCGRGEEKVGLPYVRVSPDTYSFLPLVRAGFPKIGRMSRFCTLELADHNKFLKVNAKHHWYILNLHKTP